MWKSTKIPKSFFSMDSFIFSITVFLCSRKFTYFVLGREKLYCNSGSSCSFNAKQLQVFWIMFNYSELQVVIGNVQPKAVPGM